MANKTVSYDSNEIPVGKDVKETKMLKEGAREPYATGTNKQGRHTTKHKPFGKLGAKGFA